MPRRHTQTKAGTHKVLVNTSYESLVVHWLMQDGWQVFVPVLDNAHQTDILISDGPKYYRIQVKTVEATDKDQVVENRWKDSHVDVIVVFAKNTNFGYVMPAFSENQKKMNADGHQQFSRNNKKEFLKAFHKL